VQRHTSTSPVRGQLARELVQDGRDVQDFRGLRQRTGRAKLGESPGKNNGSAAAPLEGEFLFARHHIAEFFVVADEAPGHVVIRLNHHSPGNRPPRRRVLGSFDHASLVLLGATNREEDAR
jgi:hypothetical protein